jgi:hypothetical protein
MNSGVGGCGAEEEGRRRKLTWQCWQLIVLVAVEGKNSGVSRQGTVAAVVALLLLPPISPLVLFLSVLFCFSSLSLVLLAVAHDAAGGD